MIEGRESAPICTHDGEFTMNDLFPETINQGTHGAEWWAGNWQCRNFKGYFQSREDGHGTWRFQVPWFSNDGATCSVYRIDAAGQHYTSDGIPIDDGGGITILGRKYDRRFWDH